MAIETPALQVQGLGKQYGTHSVFRNVSFQAKAGEVLAVLGESGVGKSTLLNCLAGLDTVSQGQVHVQGYPVLEQDEFELATWRRRHVGFVFQAFHVLPHLTVAQNVGLPLMLLGISPPQRRERVQDLLQQVGLSGFEDREPRTLSGGQLQRVAMARALVHRPHLVLADEPTGNLDPETAERIIELLLQRSRDLGAVCVLVTHSQAAASRADRILHLKADGIHSLA